MTARGCSLTINLNAGRTELTSCMAVRGQAVILGCWLRQTLSAQQQLWLMDVIDLMQECSCCWIYLIHLLICCFFLSVIVNHYATLSVITSGFTSVGLRWIKLPLVKCTKQTYDRVPAVSGGERVLNVCWTAALVLFFFFHGLNQQEMNESHLHRTT